MRRVSLQQQPVRPPEIATIRNAVAKSRFIDASCPSGQGYRRPRAELGRVLDEPRGLTSSVFSCLDAANSATSFLDSERRPGPLVVLRRSRRPTPGSAMRPRVLFGLGLWRGAI